VEDARRLLCTKDLSRAFFAQMFDLVEHVVP
jgi:hypothetical protein